jgi:hypothetical protein
VFKVNRGRGVGKFGKTEKALTLNKTSLAVSFAIAVLTWVTTSLVPELQDESGALGAAAGILAQVAPMLILWLRSNKDIAADIKEKK